MFHQKSTFLKKPELSPCTSFQRDLMGS